MDDQYLIRGLANTPAWKAVERLGKEILDTQDRTAIDNKDPNKTVSLVFNAQGAREFADKLFRVIQAAGYDVQAKGE